MLTTRKKTNKKTIKRSSRARAVGKSIEEVSRELNPKQLLFCELYIFDKECFANGSKSYQRAYGLKDSQLPNARRMAYALLTNIHIKDYLRKLLRDSFKSDIMDEEVARLAVQNKDLASKARGLELYNKIVERVKDPAGNTFVFKWKDPKKPRAPEVVETITATPKKPISKGKFQIKEGR